MPAKTAEKILRDYVKATPKDKVAVLTDGVEPQIARAFVKACEKLSIPCRLQRIRANRAPSSPIPEAAQVMRRATVLIAPTRNSVTHSNETIQGMKRGLRGVTIPDVTAKVFAAISRGDSKQIDASNAHARKAMRAAGWARVTTPSGSDFAAHYKGRHVGDNGTDFSKRGDVSNLPAGEVFTAPLEDGTQGVVAIDYYNKLITPHDKAKVWLERGRIVEWSKGAEPLIKRLKKAGPNGFILGEFALGTNKAHKKPVGNVLYDEKVWGTVHVAFGQNTGFGGRNRTPVHEDVILTKPSVWFGGKKFFWK